MSDERTHCVVAYTFHKTSRFSITSTIAGGERIKRKNTRMEREGWEVHLLATGLSKDAADAMKEAVSEAYRAAGYKHQPVGQWNEGEYLDGLVDGKYQG